MQWWGLLWYEMSWRGRQAGAGPHNPLQAMLRIRLFRTRAREKLLKCKGMHWASLLLGNTLLWYLLSWEGMGEGFTEFLLWPSKRGEQRSNLQQVSSQNRRSPSASLLPKQELDMWRDASGAPRAVRLWSEILYWVMGCHYKNPVPSQPPHLRLPAPSEASVHWT